MMVSIYGLATLSSKGDIEILGRPISPEIQCVLATWSFLGIVSSICAGVAVIHRLGTPLRVFFAYLFFSFFLILVPPMVFLLSGSICDKMASQDLQQEGSAFVCGFTDTFAFFCLLVFATCNMYSLYIVWSACEEICRSPFPQLIQYAGALRDVHMPDHPPKYNWPMSNNRAAAFGSGIKGMDPGMLMQSYGVVANPADESYGKPPKQDNMAEAEAGKEKADEAGKGQNNENSEGKGPQGTTDSAAAASAANTAQSA